MTKTSESSNAPKKETGMKMKDFLKELAKDKRIDYSVDISYEGVVLRLKLIFDKFPETKFVRAPLSDALYDVDYVQADEDDLPENIRQKLKKIDDELKQLDIYKSEFGTSLLLC